MEILRNVYQEFELENIKSSKFSNTLKKLMLDDTNPLYKGFDLDQFSLNFQCVKWASTSDNRVLYNNPFVANIKIIINYCVKFIIKRKKTLPKLNLINDE